MNERPDPALEEEKKDEGAPESEEARPRLRIQVPGVKAGTRPPGYCRCNPYCNYCSAG